MGTHSGKYFESYGDLQVHELLLKDTPRIQAFYNAIIRNKSIFEGKVVLDVGAGTGILSAFCAKAGASLVYAVEASNLATVAQEIMIENDISTIVKVIHSTIEELELPIKVGKVDIIISEWMGFYLLHEGMLDSVIFARNKFLKPDGFLFPSEALIYVAPCSVPKRFEFWNCVNGIKMSKFASHLRTQNSHKPEILNIDPQDLLHEGIAMQTINLKEVTLEDLNEISFKDVIVTQKSGVHQGFCIWFDCIFPINDSKDTIILSTSPNAPPTHWKQCIIVLPEPCCGVVTDCTPVAFQISLKRDISIRKYNIEIELLDPWTETHRIPCNCPLPKCVIIKEHLQSVS